MLYNELDLTGTTGRVFVVGDIHGCFDVLEQELVAVGFNEDTDFLFSVGDLVDRGPHSMAAGDYLMKHWFYAVRGNHEEMCLPETAGTHWHVRNGGQWYNDNGDKAARLATLLTSLPKAMLVTLPSGKKMGLCHASLPALKRQDEMFLTDWNDVLELVLRDDWPLDEDPFLWDRTQVSRAAKLASMLQNCPEMVSERKLREFNPDNVDLVFFGHTPLKEPLTVGKCSWLDTGCFATGRLTVKEVK